MKKNLILLALILASSSNVFAFSELGVSHKSCVHAEQDALNMADDHCIGIDTQGVTKAKFSQCHEQKALSKNRKTFKVKIFYTCKLPDFNQGYGSDFASN